LLNKLIKNLIFAMNFDDKVPEHIIEEIFRQKKGKNKSGSVAYGGDALTNTLHVVEPEIKTKIESEADYGTETETDYGTITEFNAEVEKKIKGIQFQDEAFFSEIVGYADIKRLLILCIQSSEPMHIIFDGPPASAKSMFLLQMQKKLENTYYVDCTNASGPGMVEYLFKNDVKYLLLDEVEKMSKCDQNVLLNVMETGILTSTKVKKTATKEMNLSIYATTNNIDGISKPFRSRFLEFSLPSYTYEDFCNISVKLLAVRYELDEKISLNIADKVWNKIKSRDVRDTLAIGKLSKSVDDVDFIATTLQKYKRRNEEE
jgi:Holliday junction resolvasome RuvABC ATP-dependent DNA helicase subunit